MGDKNNKSCTLSLEAGELFEILAWEETQGFQGCKLDPSPARLREDLILVLLTGAGNSDFGHLNLFTILFQIFQWFW
jgi:hypothetical protein